MGVAQAPEGRRIFNRMTVMENLELGRLLHGKPDPNDLARVFGLFPRLEERKNQIAGTMSGGEQQMLAIGRALMARPSVLLLDEPSLGLSPILVDTIFQIIQDINAQGTTVLLVEQNALKALAVANRGYVIQTGQIVLSGTATSSSATTWCARPTSARSDTIRVDRESQSPAPRSPPSLRRIAATRRSSHRETRACSGRRPAGFSRSTVTMVSPTRVSRRWGMRPATNAGSS